MFQLGPTYFALFNAFGEFHSQTIVSTVQAGEKVSEWQWNPSIVPIAYRWTR